MRIKTLFTLAAAILFAFVFTSFSPPVSAKTSTIRNDMKVLIVGTDSATGTVIATLAAANISTGIVCVSSRELEQSSLLASPPLLNKSLLSDVRDYPPETTYIVRQKENKPTFQLINYRQPESRFFNGFDNLARGKI